MAIKVNAGKTTDNKYTPKDMFERANIPRFYVDRAGVLVFVPKFWSNITTMWGVYSVPLSDSSYSLEENTSEELKQELLSNTDIRWAGPYKEVDVEITYNEPS